MDDSDEDDHCALSENWTFQPESRRWSRVCDVAVQHVERLQALSASSQVEEVDRDDGDADAADGDLEPDGEGDVDADDGEADTVEAPRYGSLPPGALAPAPVDVDLLAVRFRRTGSERLKDSAKALLRRMESLKSRRRKRQYREGVVISGPQVLDLASMQRRIEDLNCVDVDTVVAIVHADANGSPTRCRRLRRDDAGALSDSEATPTSWRHQYLKDANSNHTKLLEFVDADRDKLCSSASSRQPRTSSINLGKSHSRFKISSDDRQRHKWDQRRTVCIKFANSEFCYLLGFIRIQIITDISFHFLHALFVPISDKLVINEYCIYKESCSAYHRNE